MIIYLRPYHYSKIYLKYVFCIIIIELTIMFVDTLLTMNIFEKISFWWENICFWMLPPDFYSQVLVFFIYFHTSVERSSENGRYWPKLERQMIVHFLVDHVIPRDWVVVSHFSRFLWNPIFVILLCFFFGKNYFSLNDMFCLEGYRFRKE